MRACLWMPSITYRPSSPTGWGNTYRPSLGASTLRAVQDEETATDAFAPGCHDDRREGAVLLLRADCTPMPKRGDRITVAGKAAKVLHVSAESNDPVLRIAYGSILHA